MCEYTSTTIITEDVNMEKYIYDKNNGLWYELRGDYYIPCLTVSAQEERPVGIWGQRHLRYIKAERKAHDQMLWVQRMNNIRDRAMEIVNQDLIYA